MALRSRWWKSPPSPSWKVPKPRCRKWPRFGPKQQRALGLLAYHHLAHLEKVASLVPPEKLTRVSEAAARAQGMELRVFSELSDAIGWLVA
jgi:hypothetical protein